MALNNYKGANLARRDNICKYICTQHRTIKMQKANTNRPKWRKKKTGGKIRQRNLNIKQHATAQPQDH